MRRTLCRSILACAITVVALPSIGQVTASQGLSPSEIAAARQQPYTEEFKVDSVNTAPDLTTTTHETKYVEAKDSHLRSFALTIDIQDAGKRDPLILGIITDPEIGTSTQWDNRSRRVVVANWPEVDRRYGCWQTDEGQPRISFGFRSSRDAHLQTEDDRIADSASNDAVTAAQPAGPVHEDLGIATIQGVEAHGERWTWPPSGDESVYKRHAFLSSERWVATGPGLLVKQLVEYPRIPGRTRTYSRDLVKLTMGEPNAAMFAPPADYEIVTEEMHEVPCGRTSWPMP